MVKGVARNVTDLNKHKYPQPYDKLFYPFSVKHKAVTILILGLGLVHWKVTKIFYSRFYMFDMFKAHWQKAQYLRETQDKKWGIVFLAAIDALIIIVGIVGLIIVGLNFNSQLSITLIETIILTIYLIILQFIERYYMRRIFSYTEDDDKIKTSEAMKKYKGKHGAKL